MHFTGLYWHWQGQVMLNKGYIKCRWAGSLHHPPQPGKSPGKSQESRFGSSMGTLGVPELKQQQNVLGCPLTPQFVPGTPCTPLASPDCPSWTWGAPVVQSLSLCRLCSRFWTSWCCLFQPGYQGELMEVTLPIIKRSRGINFDLFKFQHLFSSVSA